MIQFYPISDDFYKTSIDVYDFCGFFGGNCAKEKTVKHRIYWFSALVWFPWSSCKGVLFLHDTFLTCFHFICSFSQGYNVPNWHGDTVLCDQQYDNFISATYLNELKSIHHFILSVSELGRDIPSLFDNSPDALLFYDQFNLNVQHHIMPVPFLFSCVIYTNRPETLCTLLQSLL